MANSLYSQYHKPSQMDMLTSLKRDPVSMLKQAGYNIPSGMNNPRQIVQHLIQSGQVASGRLGQIQAMARSMMK